MIFLIVVGVIIGTAIFLVIASKIYNAISSRKELLNSFVPGKEPKNIRYTFTSLDSTTHSSDERIVTSLSNFLYSTRMVEYCTNEIPRYKYILDKCSLVMDYDGQERFENKECYLEDQKSKHSSLRNQYKDELESYFSDFGFQKYPYTFPYDFIGNLINNRHLVELTNAGEYIVATSKNGIMYLFLAECVLVINDEEANIQQQKYPFVRCIRSVETVTCSCSEGREVVGTGWKYERVRGGPDLRYSYNPRHYFVNAYEDKVSFFDFENNAYFNLKEQGSDLDRESHKYNEYVADIYHLPLPTKDDVSPSSQKTWEEKQASTDDYLHSNLDISQDRPIIHVPSGTTTIKNFAFYKRINLKEVSIPSSVKAIGNYAFDNCPNLKKVTFESGSELETIGDSAFCDCGSLEEIRLPASLKSIGSHAFSGCRFLHATCETDCVLKLTSKIESIECDAFTDTLITKLYLESGKIQGIFHPFPKEISDIIIPSDIGISEYAELLSFAKGKGFNSINVDKFNRSPVEVGNLSDITFYGTNICIPNCVKQIENCKLGKDVEKVSIPNGTILLDRNFFHYKQLKEIKLPDYLKDFVKIPKQANVTFEDTGIAPSLENEISISQKTAKQFSIINMAYAKKIVIEEVFEGLSELIGQFHNINSVKLNFPTGTIPPSLFQGCKTLKEVVCNEAISVIGDSAFEDCTQLCSFKANGIKKIGSKAFKGTSLTDTSSLANATAIGAFCFDGCSKLINAVFNKVKYLGEGAFQNCHSLEAVTLNKKLKTIPAHCFDGCRSLTKLISNFDVVEAYGFAGCSSINLTEKISKLKTIEQHAFENNYKLEKVEINNNVTNIGQYAFAGCLSLRDFKLAGKIKLEDFCLSGTQINCVDQILETALLGIGVFADCKKITEVKIPYGINAIPRSLFENCTGLTSVYIPDSVLTIGVHSFYGCSSLKQLTGMSELVKISNECFGDCTSLTKLIFPLSLKEYVNAAPRCKNLVEIVFTGDLEKLSINTEGCPKLKRIYAPLKVNDSNLNQANGPKYLVMRGSSWIRQWKVDIVYVQKDEYLITLNKCLLEAGYSLMPTDRKIEMNEHYFGKFDDSFSFDLNDPELIEEKPVVKKRAEWDTTTVKEENKTQPEVSTKKSENVNDVAVYQGQLPFEHIQLSNDNTNEEQIECDRTIVSSLFAVKFKPRNGLQSGYSFIVDSLGHPVSNVIQINQAKENSEIKFNLEMHDDAENGKASIVVVDGNFTVTASKKVYIDRAYNIDALLDF